MGAVIVPLHPHIPETFLQDWLSMAATCVPELEVVDDIARNGEWKCLRSGYLDDGIAYLVVIGRCEEPLEIHGFFNYRPPSRSSAITEVKAICGMESVRRV